LKWESISVKYSFEEGNFYALVTTADEEHIGFKVDSYNNGPLQDYYVAAKWEAEIMQDCRKKADELFGSQVSVFVDVRVTGKGVVKNLTNIPPYSEVSVEMGSKTQITFKGDFTETKSVSMVEIIKWIVSKQYNSNVSFISDDMFIDIPHQSIGMINNEADLEKFRLE
jgi:hypothetical protein